MDARHVVVWLVLVMLPASVVQGQGSSSGGATMPSMDQLKSRMEDATTGGEMGQDEKDRITRLYNEAMDLRGRLDRWQEDIAGYRNDIEKAPERLDELRDKLDNYRAPTLEAPAWAPLEKLEQRLERLRQRRRDEARSLQQLVEEPARRNERRREIAEQLPALREQLQEVQNQLGSVDRTEGSVQVKQARRTVLELRKRLVEKTLEALELEQKVYDVESPLLEARRRLASQNHEALEGLVAGLAQRVAQWRAEKARRRLDDAKQLKDRLGKKNAEQAERVVELAEEWTGEDGLVKRMTRHASNLDKASRVLQQVERDYQRVVQQEQIAGLTRSMGRLLRVQRTNLPDRPQFEARMRSVRNEMNDVQVRQLELKEQRLELDGAQADDTSELVRRHQQLLDELAVDYEQYFGLLVQEFSVLKRLTEALETFEDYINARILWIRSASPIGGDDPGSTVDALAWLVSPEAWTGLLRNLKRRVIDDIVVVLAAAIVFTLLVVFRGRIRDRLSSTGRGIYSEGSGRFSSTALAFLLTVVLAGTIAVPLLAIAWLLGVPEESADLSGAVAEALLGLALWFATLNVLTEIVRKQGLAEAHFKVPDGVLETFRAALPIIKWVGAPLMALTLLMEAQSNEAWQNSLGRLSLMLLMLLLAGVALWRFRACSWGRTPPGTKHDGSKWRPALYGLVILVPLMLAAASGAGYVYTTVQLAWRLVVTLWIFLGLMLVYGLCYRLLVIALARMSRIRNQRQRWRGESTAAPEQAARASEDEDEAMEPEVDLDEVSAKARRFVKVVLAAVFVISVGMVWAEVMPALGILNEVELYSVLETDGGRDPVTLGETLLAAGAIVLMVLAWRNLPELADVIVLQRVGISSSGRFAIRAITRYVVMVVGVVVALGMIGIRWGHVQWLVAAMTVGLGFGLQEIFANFVSGLILLFERPIRIGDTITIGQITGTVTRIRMRATTITDWDRKELVVPNKAFITGQLVNWTLSDNVLRLVIPVGVAYGSDTDKAVELLRKVADDHDKVLEDPKPMVVFREFGDNSLNLELRCFIPGIESFFGVTHELHLAIDRAFREADITIAFPQRDVHFDSDQPLSITLTDQRQQDQDKQPDDETSTGKSQSVRDEKGEDEDAAKGHGQSGQDVDAGTNPGGADGG